MLIPEIHRVRQNRNSLRSPGQLSISFHVVTIYLLDISLEAGHVIVRSRYENFPNPIRTMLSFIATTRIFN